VGTWRSLEWTDFCAKCAGQPEAKTQLKRLKCRWENNIKRILKEIFENYNYIYLA
jgi:hypothetical protein